MGSTSSSTGRLHMISTRYVKKGFIHSREARTYMARDCLALHHTFQQILLIVTSSPRIVLALCHGLRNERSLLPAWRLVRFSEQRNRCMRRLVQTERVTTKRLTPYGPT